jgi:hypothetical protein
MRYIYYLGIILLKLGTLNAQCPQSLVIHSKEDVDSFVSEYPDCTDLLNLQLSGPEATMEGLEQLVIVGGLQIQSTNIDTLDLSTEFTIIAAVIGENPLLKSVHLTFGDSFNNLIVDQNPLLSEVIVTGGKADQFILYSDNKALLRFNSNQQHQPTIDRLLLEGDWTITGIRPKILEYTQVVNHMEDFTSFSRINEFLDLSEVKRVYFWQMDHFSCEGITQLEQLSYLYISANELDLETVEQYYQRGLSVSLKNSENLDDLTPWSNCELKSLVIGNCPKLKSLDGIKFDSIVDKISLGNNELLQDLGSLDEVVAFFETIDDGLWDINIRDNPNLSWCKYDAICKHIITHPNRVEISGNKDHCETKEDVAETCLSNTVDTNDNQITIAPNPNNGLFKIFGIYGEAELTVFSMSGSRVAYRSISENEELDLSFLSKGTYISKIIQDKNTTIGKFIVL